MTPEIKDIKNYLHLYLGCEVDTNITWGSELVLIREMGVTELNMIVDALERKERYQHDFEHIYCKPVLHPLSSLTDKESLECGKGVLDLYPTKKGNDENGGLWSSTTYHPSQILWLLKEHFDLFGLIESGLAIDSTTIKTP